MSSSSSSYCKDPVTATLIVIIATTWLMRTTEAAPAQNPDADSWWFNACDNFGEHHSRHNRQENCEKFGDRVQKNMKNLIRRQMNTSIKIFRRDLKNINNTYSKVMQGFTAYTQSKYNDKLPKFNEPTKKTKEILPRYHVKLQKYVVALHHLMSIKLKTDAELHWQDKRKHLLEAMSRNLKNLLCEVETAVNATCQTVPERVSVSYAKDFSSNPTDITSMSLEDWGVLKHLEQFMLKSKKLPNLLPSNGKELDSAESETDLEESSTPSGDADGE